MGRPKGSGKPKPEFPALDDQEVADINSKGPEELKMFMAQTSMNHENLMLAKEMDTDLASLKEKVSVASAVYREGTNRHRQQIKCAMKALKAKGYDTGDVKDFIKADKED